MNTTGIAELWAFPLRTSAARRDMVVGGLLFLLVPVLGWLLNLGHRWHVMVRLYANEAPWFRGFTPVLSTLDRGLRVAALGLAYLSPGLALLVTSAYVDSPRVLLVAVGAVVSFIGFHAFPVAICAYARDDERDPRWFVRHVEATRRAFRLGLPYLRAWFAAWVTVGISVVPLGIAIAGWGYTDDPRWWLASIPFFLLSPWAWSVVGYAFGVVLVPEVVGFERVAREEGR